MIHMGLTVFLFILAYLLLNLWNAVVLTHQKLNRYIVPFRHTLLGELNAILANTAVLGLFLMIVLVFTKNAYALCLVLVILTGVFNTYFLGLNIFNLYYGTSFSREDLEIFRNPGEGIAKGMGGELIRELFVYYRILLFLPFAFLLVFFLKTDPILLSAYRVPISNGAVFTMIAIFILVLFLTGTLFEKMYAKQLMIQVLKSTYAIQNFGVYPYYLCNFTGITKLIDAKIEKRSGPPSDLLPTFQKYNKNKKKYVNLLDGKTYSNSMSTDDLSENIFVDPSLIKEDKSLDGILKGRNLVLVQMESMNRYLLDIGLTKDEFSFLKALLPEALDLREFYTSVGIGVSSDAEVTTLTGLWPTGRSNLYWADYDRKTQKYLVKRDLSTIVKYFKQDNYSTKALHGDYKRFYNREHSYGEIIGFDEFQAMEDFTEIKECEKTGILKLYSYEYADGKEHVSPWVSDYLLAEKVRENIHEKQGPMLLYPITMMPHIPFEFYPGEMNKALKDSQLKEQTKKYLRFADYYDDFIRRFFFTRDGQIDTDPNTVYIFYGDHGSGIKNGDIEKLVDRKLTKMEERKILIQIAGFIYVPGSDFVERNGIRIRKGLLKGHQDLVRGQMDLNRTIIDLFGLNGEKDAYFGVSLLSKEPTFILDNKLQDVVTDKVMFSMRNTENTFPSGVEIGKGMFDIVKEFKLMNERLLQKPECEKKLNERMHASGSE